MYWVKKSMTICLVQHTEKLEYFLPNVSSWNALDLLLWWPPLKKSIPAQNGEEHSSSKRLEESTPTFQCAVLGQMGIDFFTRPNTSKTVVTLICLLTCLKMVTVATRASFHHILSVS